MNNQKNILVGISQNFTEMKEDLDIHISVEVKYFSFYEEYWLTWQLIGRSLLVGNYHPILKMILGVNFYQSCQNYFAWAKNTTSRGNVMFPKNNMQKSTGLT